MINRFLFRFWIGVICVVIAAVILRIVILGSAPRITLLPAPPLASDISRGIGPIGNSTSLPVAGEDYNIQTVKYFENGHWVVVSFTPVKQNGDGGLIVMKKINGVYQTLLGPGSEFSPSYKYDLPVRVGQYLSQIGALNE